METRRWKAFLRLEGEATVEQDDDIMNEFKGFVQALRRIGINYSIVVNVQQGKPQQIAGRPRQTEMTRGASQNKRTERIGELS